MFPTKLSFFSFILLDIAALSSSPLRSPKSLSARYFNFNSFGVPSSFDVYPGETTGSASSQILPIGSLNARLRAALQDARQREAAVARYVARNLEGGRTSLAGQLTLSARRMLGLFAGVDAIRGRKPGGLQAIADFVEEAVPPAERETAAQALLRLLNGVLFELNQAVREAHGQKPLSEDDPQAIAWVQIYNKYSKY